MIKGFLSWVGIFLTGLAVGTVASRLWTFRSAGDPLSNAVYLEAGLVAALLLLGGGMVMGARRVGLASASAHARIGESRGISLGRHVIVANRRGRWVLRLQELGVYDSVEVTIPYSGEWHLPFRIPWGRKQMSLIAFASIAFATIAQYTFTDANSNGAFGVALYSIATGMFIAVVHSLEADKPPPPAAETAAAEAPRAQTRIGIRNMLLGVGVLAILAVLSNPDLVRWDHDQTLSFRLWVFGIICFSAAFLPWKSLASWSIFRPRLLLEESLRFLRARRMEVFSLCVIFVVAFVARVFDLSQIPRTFGGDEGEMSSSALEAINGKLINPFITGWFSHPTLFFFLQAFSMRLFGETVFGVRLLSVIAGTLTVLTAYWLVHQLFDKWLAILTAGLLAIYAAHIHYSRLALNNIEDGLIACLVLGLMYRGLVTRKVMYFVGAGLTLGLGLYFYQGVRIVPIIVVLLLAYWLISDHKTIRSNISNLAIMWTAAFLAAAPLLMFFYSQPSALTSRLVQVNILMNGLLTRATQSPGGALPFILEQLRRSFMAFNLVPETSIFYGLGGPMLDPVSGLLFVFGLAYSIYRIRSKPYFVMLLWFLAGEFLGSVLISDPPASSRLQIIFVPVIFFVGLGLRELGRVIVGLWPRVARPVWSLAAGVLILIAILNVKTYFVDYTPKESYGGDPALAATEMGNYFLGYPRPFKAYVLEDVGGFIHIGTLHFMVPQLDALSVDNKILSTPDFVDASRDALFVIFPSRASEFDSIRNDLPGGERVDFRKRDGSLLFFVYEVPKS